MVSTSRYVLLLLLCLQFLRAQNAVVSGRVVDSSDAAIPNVAGRGSQVPTGELRRDTQNGVDELTLRYRIALGDPAELTLADCMHRLVTFDRPARFLNRSESKARRDPLLDEPMVLLDDVVQVGHGSAATASTEFTGLLELGNRAGVGRDVRPR